MLQSWDFTLESKDSVIDSLMPIFIEQEKQTSFDVHSYYNRTEEEILQILEESTREHIGHLMDALVKHLKRKPGCVRDLRLSYMCDHSASECWTIEGTYNSKPLSVDYTSDWYTSDAVEVTVGERTQRNITGWLS
jgi:hypothetical protein